MKVRKVKAELNKKVDGMKDVEKCYVQVDT